MKAIQFWTTLLLVGVLFAGCSSTTLSGSWKNPDYNNKVKKIYIVGIANQETHRRIFEDDFNQQLSNHGVTGLSSYKDLPTSSEIDEFKIAQNIKANGADSVLMIHVTGKRTEEIVNPGRITTYDGGRYYERPYYRNYGSYYNQRREVIYEPATITQFDVVTVEANIYDTKTTEMIWSAQLETVIDGKLQKLLKDFVKTVVKDLDRKGVI